MPGVWVLQTAYAKCFQLAIFRRQESWGHLLVLGGTLEDISFFRLTFAAITYCGTSQLQKEKLGYTSVVTQFLSSKKSGLEACNSDTGYTSLSCGRSFQSE
jgi:hypothetical protein